MDKEKHYLDFRHHLHLWLDCIAALEKDVKEILQDGPVDLTAFPFGSQPYEFKSINETLYCYRAYYENDNICIEAGRTENPDKISYVLDWNDMTQDEITLSDFMDCIYNNKDLQWDNRNEDELQGELKTLSQAACVIERLSHRDKSGYLQKRAGEIQLIIKYTKEIRKLMDEKYKPDNLPKPANPFCIPDLTPMLEKVTKYVKQKQGEKGFILTDNPQLDTIWAITYNGFMNTACELEVKAVRVNTHGTLQVIVDDSHTVWDEDAVKMVKEDDATSDYIGNWEDVAYSDSIYFVPTIFNIAECIEEYAS